MTRTLTGRTVIYTDVDVIDRNNVVEVLNKALETHNVNKNDIQYLYDYYKGKQPILERVKDIRPEINNKLVENRANEIVSFKVGYLMGEPIQYVCRGGSDEHSEAINQLNEFVFAEDKAAKDKELADWFTICGTSFRMVLPDAVDDDVDEAPFEIYTLDPRYSFVVYHNGLGNKRKMGVKYIIKQDNSIVYIGVATPLTVNLTMDADGNITADKTFAEIKAASDDGKVVNAKFKGTIVPLGHLTDSEAIFTLTIANSSEVSTGSFTCTSNNVWSMLQDGFRITAGYSLGISGASVGQTVKIKAVDENGAPTEWEAADMASGGDGAEIDISREPDLILEVSKAVVSLSISEINGQPINATEMVVLWEHPGGAAYVPNYFRFNNEVKNATDGSAALANFNLPANACPSSTTAAAIFCRVKKINNGTYRYEFSGLQQNVGTLTGVNPTVYGAPYRNNLIGETSIKEFYVYQASNIQEGCKVSVWVK